MGMMGGRRRRKRGGEAAIFFSLANLSLSLSRTREDLTTFVFPEKKERKGKSYFAIIPLTNLTGEMPFFGKSSDAYQEMDLGIQSTFHKG